MEISRSWLIPIAFVLLDALRRSLASGSPVPNYCSENQCSRSELERRMLVVRDSKIHLWTPDMTQNIWELSGLFEGDIIVHPNELNRNAITNPSLRWPGGVIPYVYDADFPSDGRQKVEEAMEELQQLTCVRFRPTEYGKDISWVKIKSGRGERCSSAVGRWWGEQNLFLAPRCYENGIVTVQHELLHTLGFEHQHAAAERDRYVKINWANIERGSEVNFYARKTQNLSVEYDYGSVMHYSRAAFSTNGRDTITPLRPDVQIGQRERLSEKDILKVQRLYPCNERHDPE